MEQHRIFPLGEKKRNLTVILPKKMDQKLRLSWQLSLHFPATEDALEFKKAKAMER